MCASQVQGRGFKSHPVHSFSVLDLPACFEFILKTMLTILKAIVEKISSISDNLGIPVEELPERINGLKRSVDDISFEIRDLIIKKDRAISSYNTTVADLEEYRRNRPLIETLKTKDEELETERERRINPARTVRPLDNTVLY